jgi:hypothetical protein
MIEAPAESEYAPFYKGYVSLVPEADALAVLEAQPAEIDRVAASVAPERETFRYAEGKWSIRELLGHVGDGERVFGHRAFCIARGEAQSLPGFDEKAYLAQAGYDRVPLRDLAGDFRALRDANLRLFRRLDEAAWLRLGSANGSPVSVRALARIMAGHVRHHLGVLRSRYPVSSGA